MTAFFLCASARTSCCIPEYSITRYYSSSAPMPSRRTRCPVTIFNASRTLRPLGRTSSGANSDHGSRTKRRSSMRGCGTCRCISEIRRSSYQSISISSVRWGPRTLDIDILWYDERRISEMHLQVPHPRIEERRFVLEPWSELAPELVLPSGRRVREALKIVTGQRVRRLGIGAEEE